MRRGVGDPMRALRFILGATTSVRVSISISISISISFSTSFSFSFPPSDFGLRTVHTPLKVSRRCLDRSRARPTSKADGARKPPLRVCIHSRSILIGGQVKIRRCAWQGGRWLENVE